MIVDETKNIIEAEVVEDPPKENFCSISVQSIADLTPAQLIETVGMLDTITDDKELRNVKRMIRESQSVQTLDVAQMKLLINMAKELLKNPDSNASRRLVDTFIEKVLVYKDRIEVQLNAAPFLSKSKYAKMVEVLPRYPI